MVQGHHLQLRSCPPLFCNFWLLIVKVAATHHPIIQKEVDGLLSRGVIGPSSGGAGFYSSVFVVPKCTGGLWPILSLKWFNHYLYIPSFKMSTIRHVWQLIQHGDYAFSIDLQDTNLHIPIVEHHHHFFLQFFGTICHIIGKFYLLGWLKSLGFLQPSLNLSCSFTGTTFYVLLSIWMISWSWFALSGQVRGLAHFFFLIGSPCITY